MPLKIAPGMSGEHVFLVGFDDDGKPGVALLSGQVGNIVSADPVNVVIVLDSPSLPTDVDIKQDDGTVVPAGTVSQASGMLSIPPGAPNSTVNVTGSVRNSDGTQVLDDTGAPVGDLVDVVTIQATPKLLKREGVLFSNASSA